jgi:GAF domain-containing protein
MASGSDLPPPVAANVEPAPSVEPPALTPTTELTELDPLTSPPPETDPSVPGLELVAMRKEEPTDAVPITYREYSFAVAEGTDPEEHELLARAAWEQVRAAIGHVASQKFVQIALFDHRFEGRPLRPPIVVLVWKDWRGDPVVQVRGARTPATAPYPPTSLRPAAPASTAKASFPAPNAPGFPAAPAEPHQAVPAAAEPAPVEAASAPALDKPAPAVALVEAAPAAVPVEAAAPAVAAPAEAPAAPVAAEPTPAEPARSTTPSRPGSSPGIASRKKRSSEDLIGELFEQMHQLHFMPDMVAGAEYVLGVILRVMPSEGILIHVFDINTRQFVVVRASGPNARGVLLHRTPDTFKLFRDVFRRSSAIVVADASADANFQGGRWERLGVAVKSALCGAVKQGGRYLAVIELANAAGGAPFQVSEVNALDYICGQFAEFVASKPLVIDDDAVLPRT